MWNDLFIIDAIMLLKTSRDQRYLVLTVFATLFFLENPFMLQSFSRFTIFQVLFIDSISFVSYSISLLRRLWGYFHLLNLSIFQEDYLSSYVVTFLNVEHPDVFGASNSSLKSMVSYWSSSLLLKSFILLLPKNVTSTVSFELNLFFDVP